MRTMIAGVSALTLTLSLGAMPVLAEEEGQVTAWRLFVSDHSKPVVRAIDAMDGDTLATFDLKGPATLYRSDSGAGIYAVQTNDNIVTAIASGITFHDHGDHGDIDVEAPSLTGAMFEGNFPVHLVEHSGHWAAFFDKDGETKIFEEHEALEGHSDSRIVKAGAPHHGVAIPYGELTLISVPHPTDTSQLPIGIEVLDAAGARQGEIAECPDLHGEAASGDLTAIACTTGLLLVRARDGVPQIEHLPYAGDLPDGKATTLIGGVGLQYFLGNYGPSAVVIIDPSAEQAFRIVELPTRRVHFAVDPIRSQFAYIFTEDGTLHQLNVLTGEIVNSVKLTQPYSMDGSWADPRPRIAVAGDEIIVSDPLASKLVRVNAISLEKAGEIPVEGTPFNVIAVGGTGTAHDGEDEHDHEEESHNHG